MIIELKDLQVGDEFLIGSNSKFRWMKLVRPIKMHKLGKRWSAARCSTRINIIPGNGKYDYKLKMRVPNTKKEYECSNVHNTEVWVDLNWKDIWLIKKGI